MTLSAQDALAGGDYCVALGHWFAVPRLLETVLKQLQIDANPYRKGEIVIVTCPHGRRVQAEVVMASENGRSLVVKYEAIIAGFAGTMAIWEQDDGSFVELFTGAPMKLERPV